MTKIEIFRQFSPLNSLSGQFLSDVVKQCRVYTAPKGTMLFKRGKILADHFFLLEGEVDLINNEFGVEKVKSGAERSTKPLNSLSPTAVSAVAKTAVRYFTINMDLLSRQIAAANRPVEAEVASEHFTYDNGEIGMEVGDLSDATDWMACLLQSPLFSRIPWGQVHELFSRFETIGVSAGERLIREGAEGDYFYVLASGKALVSDRSGSVHLELSQGHYFGEESLISKAPRNASVVMLTDGMVKRLSREDFTSLVTSTVIQKIERKALDKQKKPVKFLDVRLPMEYRAGHLDGSINIPLSRLRDGLQDLGPTNFYVVSDEAGPRADIAVYLLCKAGFDAAVLKDAASLYQACEAS